MTFTTFNTLEFAKRLEEAGVEPKIAETQAELQAEYHEKIVEVFTEYEPILGELKINRHELATKGDIQNIDRKLDKFETRLDKMDARLDKMEGKIDCLRNELIFKLGSILVAGMSVLGVVLALIINHGH